MSAEHELEDNATAWLRTRHTPDLAVLIECLRKELIVRHLPGQLSLATVRDHVIEFVAIERAAQRFIRVDCQDGM